MTKFTVRKGRRYEAIVRLSWAQGLFGNEAVANRFRAVGFTDVKVEGRGRVRRVEGLWPHADASAEIPAEIDPASIQEIQQVAGR